MTFAREDAGAISQTQANWFYFIALSGEEAREWVVQYYRLVSAEFRQDLAFALAELRAKRIQEGRRIVLRASRRLESLGDISLSFCLVAQRLYYPVLAYLQYCEVNFDAAELSLSLADDAVREAIEVHDFLIPLADSGVDFSIQRIRMARRRRRWSEMRREIEILQDKIDDRMPLYALESGKGIYFSVLNDFYRSLPASTEDLEALRHLLDGGRRAGYADQIVQSLYAIPGFVIPY